MKELKVSSETQHGDRALVDRQAQWATEVEHQLNVTEAIRLYSRAIFWSSFFCLALLMVSFDPQVFGNLYATPSFQRKFGYEFEGEYIIPAAWQTGLAMGSPIGQVIGSLGAGFPLERYGRKLLLGVCVVGTIGCVLIQLLSPSLQVLLVGELLAGLITELLANGVTAALQTLSSQWAYKIPLQFSGCGQSLSSSGFRLPERVSIVIMIKI